MMAGLQTFYRGAIMATNYATETLTTAIKQHLLTVEAIPPNTDVSKLAGELAQVCLTELNSAGMESDTIEELFAPQTFTAKARGID
jgi:hypothetical protein